MALRKGERTRQHIVEQAAELFNKKGYEGCSLADLTEATGIKKGGLYRHFEGKEELAVEAYQHIFERVSKARLAALDLQPTRRDALKAFVRAFVDPLEPLIPGGCPIMNLGVEADDGNQRLLALVQAALARWSRRVAEIIEAGVEEGEFAPTAVEPVATFLIAGLEGGLLLARVRKDRQPLKDVAAFLDGWIDTVLRKP